MWDFEDEDYFYNQFLGDFNPFLCEGGEFAIPEGDNGK